MNDNRNSMCRAIRTIITDVRPGICELRHGNWILREIPGITESGSYTNDDLTFTVAVEEVANDGCSGWGNLPILGEHKYH